MCSLELRYKISKRFLLKLCSFMCLCHGLQQMEIREFYTWNFAHINSNKFIFTVWVGARLRCHCSIFVLASLSSLFLFQRL